jgi:D-sedoheptulose 7-phosphate isomerase
LGRFGEVGRCFVTIAAIRTQIQESIAVKLLLFEYKHLIGQIEGVACACVESLLARGKDIFAGNGGSFAVAQHLSVEFKSRLMSDRETLASVVLGANNSSIRAVG